MSVAVERYLEREEALEAEHKLTRERWARFALTGEARDHADIVKWAGFLPASAAEEK